MTDRHRLARARRMMECSREWLIDADEMIGEMKESSQHKQLRANIRLISSILHSMWKEAADEEDMGF